MSSPNGRSPSRRGASRPASKTPSQAEKQGFGDELVDPARAPQAPGPRPGEEQVDRHARKVLAEVSIEAEAAGVPCNTRVATAESPWRGILEVAAKAGCDAIVMSSHGRSNLGGLLLGSETARVLSHSKIPVIVFR